MNILSSQRCESYDAEDEKVTEKDKTIKDNDDPVSIRWENSLKQRYYLVIIQQDIFGHWILMRAWGGIQKAGGQTQVTVLEDKNEGLGMLPDISIRRKKRGYTQVT